MRTIKIDVPGRILHGAEQGRFVRILDDSRETGGFLIVTSADPGSMVEVYDSWVESIVEVDLFAAESNWEIEWLESGSA